MKFRKPGIILNPNESWFFALHTTKSTSCINIAPPIKQLVIEDENLAIWPGHHWRFHGNLAHSLWNFILQNFAKCGIT